MWIAHANRYICICSSINSEMYIVVLPHVARIGLEMSFEYQI